MADRKEELKKAREAGGSIVAKQFAEKQEPADATKPSDIKKINHGHGSILYHYDGKGYKTMEEAQKAKDAKEGTTSDMKNASTGGSLVAKQFAEHDGKPYQATKNKTWTDIKSENGNDPAKIADYLNNTSSYKPGELTKKGMAEMGYKQGEDGKWTIDNVLDEIDNISDSDKKVETAVQSFTNPETGEVDEEKANTAVNEYEQRLVELGAATYDKDGNFILKPTSKGKDWETWATLLSVGLSVIGIAMGVPIIPINFRAVTGKDSRNAQIQALQTQYMNIKSDSAKTIDQMNADVGAGQIAQNNQDALAAQEKHAQATAATKDVIGAQTSAEKELIETRTDAEIRKDEEQFKRDMQRLQKDRDFQLKFAALQQQYAKEMAQLQSDLSTGSAIDVMRYQSSGFLKDLKDMGMSFSDIASYTAAKNGISPSDKNWQRVKQVSDMVNDTIRSLNPFKKK